MVWARGWVERLPRGGRRGDATPGQFLTKISILENKEYNFVGKLAAWSPDRPPGGAAAVRGAPDGRRTRPRRGPGGGERRLRTAARGRPAGRSAVRGRFAGWIARGLGLAPRGEL